MSKPDAARVAIGKLTVHPITLDELLGAVDAGIRENQSMSVFNVNAHAVCIAEEHAEFRAAMNEATLVFCDGKAVQWAARWMGTPLPERFTPPDWMDRLCSLSTKHGYRLFFLGGKEGIAAAAVDELEHRHPGLMFKTHHGYFGKQGPENEAVLSLINDFHPELLLVGFGMPGQEVWIANHLSRLSVNAAFSVGGLFDFVSKHKVRGPRWLTDNGLEWLTRLVREPRRLGRRYLLGNPHFVWIILRQRLASRQIR